MRMTNQQEKQVDERSQEKEELEGVVQRMKERLERETAAHMEWTERAHQLDQQVGERRR